jgi:hypothetical protein
VIPQALASRLRWCAVALTALTSTAQAAVFLVGSSVGCQFSTIQAGINAAAASAGEDEVRIENSASYAAQAITIGPQDVLISGAYQNCADAFPSIGLNALISGQGGAAASVFSITGSGVRRFLRLNIVGGDAPTSGRGGGIRFEGRGDLVLTGVRLLNNQAGGGGGIYFRGDGNPAVLTLESGTLIQNNTATATDGFGGGVALINTARLLMLQDNTQISSNRALGIDSVGGGIAVFDLAKADIGSPGVGINGAIYNNEAGFGGGIAVISESEADPVVHVFTTNAARPTRLQENRARRLGGAIYLRPSSAAGFPGGEANTCVFNTQIDRNFAQEGAAIYQDTDSSILFGQIGGRFAFNQNPSFCKTPAELAALGSVACASNATGCNRIEYNESFDLATLSHTNGAAILAQNQAITEIDKVTFSDNIVGSIYRGIGSYSSLDRCLIANNDIRVDLIWADSISPLLAISNCTITNNIMAPGTRIVRRDGGDTLRIKNSLFWQPGNFTLIYGGNVSNANPDIDFNVTNAITSLPPSPANLFRLPRFVDPNNRDYHLRIGSQALDVFAPVIGDDRDLDNRPYDQALSIYRETANGVRDAGAFERQENDPWIINGAFLNLNSWINSTPTLTSFSALNAAGSAGGSVVFSRAAQVGATIPRYNLLSQCFNVPAPGFYQLTGKGRAPGSVVQTRDRPVIQWRLRKNSETCGAADTIADFGNLYLPNGANFAALANPALINVPFAQWSPTATIEVRLDAEPDVLDGSIEVGFDDISLTGVPIDPIFKNGFEF